MDDVRLAGGAHLALVMLDAKVPRLADKCNVFSGAIGLDVSKKGFEAPIDSYLIKDRLGCRNSLRPRRRKSGIISGCRSGLADGRHASL